MNYNHVILNKLLDKYEKSKSYYKDINRRIIVKAQDIKEYDIEDYDKKILFHEILKELKLKRLVDFNYVKFEEGNILDEIWLEKDNIDYAYIEINRVNPKKNYNMILNELCGIEFKHEWIQQFIQDMKSYMIEKKKENRLLPFEKFKYILIALKEIDEIQSGNKINSILKRVFSKKCYNDSKYFERNIENYIIKIVKKYYLDKNDIITLNDDDILREVGIEKYPEIIEFCGNINCKINGNVIRYLDVTSGSYLNTDSILSISELELKNIDRIIWIENKANYIDYIHNKKSNELVIYHGGFYSPIKGEFFSKVYNASKNNANSMRYLHWSDIDIGGFEIFTRLKEKIVKELEPIYMDRDTLMKNQSNWNIFDENYKEKLLKLRKDKKYSLFFNTMDIMIKYNCRLEQEALLL